MSIECYVIVTGYTFYKNLKNYLIVLLVYYFLGKKRFSDPLSFFSLFDTTFTYQF